MAQLKSAILKSLNIAGVLGAGMFTDAVTGMVQDAIDSVETPAEQMRYVLSSLSELDEEAKLAAVYIATQKMQLETKNLTVKYKEIDKLLLEMISLSNNIAYLINRIGAGAVSNIERSKKELEKAESTYKGARTILAQNNYIPQMFLRNGELHLKRAARVLENKDLASLNVGSNSPIELSPNVIEAMRGLSKLTSKAAQLIKKEKEAEVIYNTLLFYRDIILEADVNFQSVQSASAGAIRDERLKKMVEKIEALRKDIDFFLQQKISSTTDIQIKRIEYQNEVNTLLAYAKTVLGKTDPNEFKSIANNAYLDLKETLTNHSLFNPESGGKDIAEMKRMLVMLSASSKKLLSFKKDQVTAFSREALYVRVKLSNILQQIRSVYFSLSSFPVFESPALNALVSALELLGVESVIEKLLSNTIVNEVVAAIETVNEVKSIVCSVANNPATNTNIFSSEDYDKFLGLFVANDRRNTVNRARSAENGINVFSGASEYDQYLQDQIADAQKTKNRI
jgi:hypothetical protein